MNPTVLEIIEIIVFVDLFLNFILHILHFRKYYNEFENCMSDVTARIDLLIARIERHFAENERKIEDQKIKIKIENERDGRTDVEL